MLQLTLIAARASGCGFAAATGVAADSSAAADGCDGKHSQDVPLLGVLGPVVAGIRLRRKTQSSYEAAVSPGRGSSTPVSGGPTGSGASGRRYNHS